MPELPEVETTIKYLREVWLNKAIKDVSLFNGGESQINVSAQEFKTGLLNRELTELSRYGKWMVFRFDSGDLEAIGHLRMSGRYSSDITPISHVHKRIEFVLSDNTNLAYIDQRRFGTWEIVKSSKEFLTLKKLGPDALSDEFSSEYLFDRLSKSKRFIYQDLLDQSFVAGLGNIYVNESLYLSGIHPKSISSKIPGILIENLVKNIKEILNLSLSLKGTTLSDNLYSTPEGKTGEFASLLKVYGKKGGPIVFEKIAGRTSYFDPKTQVLFN